ncbi:hypothetical protein [Fluviispira sanaruensis]|uniref:Glycosyltransferase subfamily 4-like N-terminal domain-containing protein n=1 Tax=Fluviispira sanaruensis TaxID=2493639 RepID=A0A4P2VMN5_FLUSA|nr:hypothetical protein [Fluviispira sanaruensis]BBH54048.1 hypothetical protein JCM31447_25050 [Fluviispira sanaruensis]
MKILLISNFFEPQNNIAVQRIKSLAKYWAIDGLKVTVLTTKKTKRFDGFLEEKMGKKLIYDILETKYIPDFMDRKEKNPFSIEVNEKRKSLFLSIKNFLPSFIDIRFFWIFTGFFIGFFVIKKNNYDVIVASYPIYHSFIIGFLLSIVTKKPLVLDYRDLCSADTSFTKYKSKTSKVFENLLERIIVKRAILVVVVSNGNKILQDNYFNINSVVIENGFDIEDKILFSSPFIKENKIKKITYLGKIIHPLRTPELLFKALQNIISGNNSMHIQFSFYSPDVNDILYLAKKYNILNSIKIHSMISRESSLKIQAESDYLLFLDWNDPAQTGVLSGKIFEYINSGTPILSIGGYEESSASKLIVDNGFGIAFYQNLDRLKETILDISNNNFRLDLKRNFEILNKFDRKFLADKYKEEIVKKLNERKNKYS